MKISNINYYPQYQTFKSNNQPTRLTKTSAFKRPIATDDAKVQISRETSLILMLFRKQHILQSNMKSMANTIPQCQLTYESQWNIPYDKREEIYSNYTKELDKIFYPDGELSGVVKQYLDTVKFPVYHSQDRNRKTEPQYMTIKQAIDNSFESLNQKGTVNAFHATLCREYADNIIENGFDVDKIYRAMYGPGFYFAYSEGAAREYSGAVLKCRFSGNMGQISSDVFQSISDHAPSKMAKDFGVTQDKFCNITKAEAYFKHMIYEYARDYIVNTKGIQVAHVVGELEGTCVVFDPDSIDDIRYIGG